MIHAQYWTMPEAIIATGGWGEVQTIYIDGGIARYAEQYVLQRVKDRITAHA